MRFGVNWNTAFAGTDPAALLAFARAAEECGFESFYVPEHVVLHPGAGANGMTFPADLPIADPLELLAFVAAATSRITLGTGVVLLPLHHPVMLAKRLATVDVLSGGRMRLFTVGVGSLPGEAERMNVDFTTRGRRADEAADVLRLLWAGGPEGVSHEGEFWRFEHATSFPKPAGGGVLPIHVGGSSPAAARRAGRLGAGFFPGGRLMPAEYADLVAIARAAADDAGHDGSALEITRWGSPDVTADGVDRLEAQGVTRLVIGAPDVATLESFAERMLR